jgi:hypothetical protein
MRTSSPGIFMTKSLLYTLNGPVQAGDGVYIERQADKELLKLCEEGTFAYVLAPRQIGKSSLIAATARKLHAQGILPAIVDLTSIGSHVNSAEQWYLSFLKVIAGRLRLQMSLSGWWQEQGELSVSHRFISFFEEIVLREIPGRVVVFVDEIDSTLSLPFSRDDFFAAIRAMNNSRADTHEFRRLTFVLLGTATPSELIADPTRTPFNIGQRVDLTDFTFDEALPLAAGLGMDSVEARQQALNQVLLLTGGQPYLTQGLCKKISQKNWHEFSRLDMDRLVNETYLDEKGKQDTHFQFMRDMLTKRAKDPIAVLTVYRGILQGQRVPDDVKSPVKAHLKLSGLVKAEKGLLRVRSPIYARVFDQQWVREQLPSLFKWYGNLPPQRKAMVAVGLPSFFVMLFLCVVTTSSIVWALGTSTQLRQAQTQVPLLSTQATGVALDFSTLHAEGIRLRATVTAASMRQATPTLMNTLPLATNTLPPATNTPVAPTGCIVTIGNSLVPLMSEPDQFSIEVIRVPLGEYSTLQYKEVPFGSHMRGWFQIQAGERTGWIRNDTWTIAAKTSACP